MSFRFDESHWVTMTLPGGHRVEVWGQLVPTFNDTVLKIVDGIHTGSVVTFSRAWVESYTPPAMTAGRIVVKIPD